VGRPDDAAVVVVTQEDDLVADLIAFELHRRGVSFFRFNTDTYPSSVSVTWDLAGAGRMETADRVVALDGVQWAWCRRSGTGDDPAKRSSGVDGFIAQEARSFLAGLWETMPWTWMNPPAAIQRAGNKLVQLRAAVDAGFRVPATTVTNDAAAARAWRGKGRVIAKSVSGAGFDVGGLPHQVFTQEVAPAALTEPAVSPCPCIFQELVERGRDVRVTVAGSRAFATDIVVAGSEPVDWRAAPDDLLRYEPVTPPPGLVRRCVSLLGDLGLRYGAFDFIRTASGDYVFLEVNPSGQWAWVEQATGQPITSAIVSALLGED
jgi:glutathione synthase/RimK-type ligase-like ATP-grasp enzyme